MKDTFYLQRQFINTGSTVEGMKTEFPFLFKNAFMMAHFNKLVGIDNTFTLLVTKFRNKGPQIMKFMKNACKTNKQIENALQCIKEQHIDVPETHPASLVLTKLAYFKEEKSILFQANDVKCKSFVKALTF